MRAVTIVKRAARSLGLEITRIRPPGDHRPQDTSRGSANRAILDMLDRIQRPIVYDVGANTGQSIQRFRALLPSSVIWAFEPSPTTFSELRSNVEGLADVILVNAGLGATAGTFELIENDNSDMTSFLSVDDAWGIEIARTDVEVLTLDEVSDGRIDLLKIDTQGFDLEVLRGATEKIRRGQIGLVMLEVTFAPLYVGQPRFDEVFTWLLDHDFELVGLYELYPMNSQAGWCDALWRPRL